jgi:HEAT repeat protein
MITGPGAPLTRDDVVKAYAAARDVDEQVALLSRGLASEDPLVRQTCAIRAGCLGPAAAACAGLLREIATGDAMPPVRSWAAYALARVGDGEGLRVLIHLSRDARTEVRSHAAIALSALGPAIPSDALPELLPLLEDPAESVRWAITWALGEMGTRAAGAATALGGLRRDPSPPVRLAASASLRKVRGLPER